MITRPDISHATGVLSQFLTNPNESHCEAVDRVYAYLNTYPELGPTYGLDNTGLIGYTDADWAGDQNERKSTSGYLYLFKGGPISWSSKRQPIIALSSTEAEYIAAVEAAKEGVHQLRLVNTFLPYEERDTSFILKEDNQSTIRMTHNPEFHSRTKHIDVKFHYIRQLVSEGTLIIDWIPTDIQLADRFTKALTKETH